MAGTVGQWYSRIVWLPPICAESFNNCAEEIQNRRTEVVRAAHSVFLPTRPTSKFSASFSTDSANFESVQNSDLNRRSCHTDVPLSNVVLQRPFWRRSSNFSLLLDVCMVDVGVTLTSLTSSMFALHGRHGQRCGANKKVRVGRLLVHRCSTIVRQLSFECSSHFPSEGNIRAVGVGLV